MKHNTALKVEPAAAPAPLPTPTLSPARQALADHMLRLRELEAKAASFTEPLEALRMVDQKLADAKAELEAITATAADAMREWVERGGEGDAPGVLPDHRRAAAERVADRQAEADAAHRLAHAIQQQAAAHAQLYGQELAKHGDFKADVVREVAAEIGRQFQSTRMQAPALKATIQQLALRLPIDYTSFNLTQLQAAKLSNDVGATIDGYDADLTEVCRQALAAWQRLWQALDSNPSAVL